MISRYVASEKTLAKTMNYYITKNVIPILDYAVESNTDKKSINEFIDKKITLFRKYNNHYHSLKLSSVDFSENACDSILENAKQYKIKLLIDSEDYLVQDTIERMTNNLVIHKHYDNEIFKTYQMYRKDMLNVLWKDLLEYKHSNVQHNIKLVRGAYMLKDKKYGMIHNNKEETNRAYNEAIKMLVETAKNNNKMNVIFATHNKSSFDTIKNIELPNVYHASLMGLDKPFINQGKVKKMVHLPFGPFHKTYPYLFRRLCENNFILDQFLSSRHKKKENKNNLILS